MRTPVFLSKGREAPKYSKLRLGDRFRPTDGLYTPKSGEGALPNIVVIPDTSKSMYIVKPNNNVLTCTALVVRRRRSNRKQAYCLYMGWN